MWQSLQQQLNEIRSKLDVNKHGFKNLIEMLRGYYKAENSNPSGLIFANL